MWELHLAVINFLNEVGSAWHVGGLWQMMRKAIRKNWVTAVILK